LQVFEVGQLRFLFCDAGDEHGGLAGGGLRTAERRGRVAEVRGERAAGVGHCFRMSGKKIRVSVDVNVEQLYCECRSALRR
jgi:hypothetical protein